MLNVQKTLGKHWYDVEAEDLIEVVLADAEQTYCFETGDKFWACGFTSRFEQWLDRKAGSDLGPQT